MTVQIISKICFCCKQQKSFTQFYKDKTIADGLGFYCKSCVHSQRQKPRKTNNRFNTQIGIFGEMPIYQKDVERYWSYVVVSDNGCWEWQKGKDRDGYGRFSCYYTSFLAHRFAYFLYNGQDPKGLLVCHTCDNPPCVSPFHLFLGTALDNNRDKETKKRGNQSKGVNHYRANTTPQQVIQIRELFTKGCSVREITQTCEISRAIVHKIIQNKNWKHI